MTLKILLRSNNPSAVVKELARKARKEHYFHLLGLKQVERSAHLKASVAAALGCEDCRPLQLQRVFAAHGFGWAPNSFQTFGLEIPCTCEIEHRLC